jgi:hypothetical protein
MKRRRHKLKERLGFSLDCAPCRVVEKRLLQHLFLEVIKERRLFMLKQREDFAGDSKPVLPVSKFRIGQNL